MTVIIWDGKTLAADRQMTVRGTRFEVRKLEVIHTAEGTGAIAWAGYAETGIAIAEAWKKNRLVEDWPEAQKGESWAVLIVAMPRKPVVYYERLPVAQEVLEGTFRAWGAGFEIAVGAMAAGADARRAMEIVCRYDNCCGLGMDAVDVPR